MLSRRALYDFWAKGGSTVVEHCVDIHYCV